MKSAAMVTYGDMVLRDVKRRKKPVQRELPVQVQALKFIELALPGSFLWHTPNGGRRSMRAALQMKALGTKPGVTDLIMLPPIDNRGLFPAYFLEAKAPKGGTLSGDQKNFRAEVLTRGFAWGIFRNNDELETLLRQWGFNLRARIRHDDQRLAGREPA